MIDIDESSHSSNNSDGSTSSIILERTRDQPLSSGSISFSSILLANGSIGGTPLAAGDVNPGPPGFLLEWVVENDGTTSWEGDYSLDVPTGWTYDCDSPGILAGGSLDYLTCTVEMPLDVTPGSMPAIGAIVNAGDLSLLDIISIQVSSAQSASISLSENSLMVLENGKDNNIEVEVRNTGSSAFEHRIVVTSLDGWDVQLIDDPTISLNQQSLALIDILVSPNEPGFGVIRVQILGPDDVVIASEDLMFESRGSVQESADSGLDGILFVFAGLLVLFGVAIILFVSKTSKSRSSSPNSFTATLPPPPTTQNSFFFHKNIDVFVLKNYEDFHLVKL